MFVNAKSTLFSCLLACCLAASALAQPSVIEDGDLSKELQVPIYQWQDPDVRQKAIVVAIHGATLHAGTFDTLAKHLAGEGYFVVALDMRGYGRWCKPPYDPDAAKHTNYIQSGKDLVAAISALRKQHPDLKVYCLGESVGANMEVRLAAENPDLIDGLIMVSPCVKRVQHLGARAVVDIFRGAIDPLLPLALTPYIARYLSDDPRVTKYYLDDPLIRNHLSMYDLLSSIETNSHCLKEVPNLSAHLPVLVIAGEVDQIYSASAVPKFVDSLPCNNKSTVVLSGKGHILVETPYLAPNVVNCIDNWLKDDLDKTKLSAYNDLKP